MAKNNNLHKAKTAKNDEFYTRIEDINEELKHYSDHFRGKTVLCNCDDPEWSNFWRYFHLEFERLGLKKLIATHYEPDEVPSYMMEYTGGNDEDFSIGIRKELTQNGDFRSPECIELLKEADIVVTNPPFSLFREYVAQLVEYDKKFLVIGTMNAITYKEFFPLIKENKVWLGNGFKAGNAYFVIPANAKVSGYASGVYNKETNTVKFRNCAWFTNLDHPKRHVPIETAYEYAKKDRLYPDLYPKYDNYDAINVDKVSQIPMDYEPCWYKCPHKDKCEYATSEGSVDNALCENACNGAIGVPITYLDKHSPEQFEIVDANNIRNNDAVSEKPHGLIKDKEATVTLNPCSQFVNVERERERERERTPHNVCKDCHSQDVVSVTAFLESPLHSSINTAQNSLKFSELQTQQDGLDMNVSPLLTEIKYTTEFLSVKKCNGIMGVPITFLDKHCSKQFILLGIMNTGEENPGIRYPDTSHGRPIVNGKEIYLRILIQKKKG